MSHAVVATWDTYVYQPDTTEPEGEALWMRPGTGRRFTFAAELEGDIVATAYLKPNQVGLGDHICNAGWMVDPAGTGPGVGRRYAEYVNERAREVGFAGVQFNAVVASNTRALRLWESLGFEIVGTVPNAFHHATQGASAVHILHREL